MQRLVDVLVAVSHDTQLWGMMLLSDACLAQAHDRVELIADIELGRLEGRLGVEVVGGALGAAHWTDFTADGPEGATLILVWLGRCGGSVCRTGQTVVVCGGDH